MVERLPSKQDVASSSLVSRIFSLLCGEIGRRSAAAEWRFDSVSSPAGRTNGSMQVRILPE